MSLNNVITKNLKQQMVVQLIGRGTHSEVVGNLEK